MKKKLITIALSSALALSTVSVGVAEGFNRMPANLPSAYNSLDSNVVSKQSTTNPLEYTFTIDAMGIPQGTVGGQWYINGVNTGVSGSSFTHTFAHSGDYNVSVNWFGFAQDREVNGNAETTVHVKSVTPAASLPDLTTSTKASFSPTQTIYNVTANVKGTKAQAPGWKYYWVTSANGNKPNITEANVVNGSAETEADIGISLKGAIYFKAVGPNGTVMQTKTTQLRFKPVEEILKLITGNYQPGKTADNYIVSVDTSGTYINPQHAVQTYFIVNGEKRSARYVPSIHSYATGITVIAPGIDGAGSKTVQFVSKFIVNGKVIQTVQSNKEVFKYKSRKLPTKAVYTVDPSIGTTAQAVAADFLNDKDSRGLPDGIASITAQGNNLVFQCKPGYYMPKKVADLAPGNEVDGSPAHRYDNVVYNKVTKKFDLAYDSNDAYNQVVGGSGVTYYWGANCAKANVTKVTDKVDPSTGTTAQAVANEFLHAKDSRGLPDGVASITAQGNGLVFQCKPGYHVPKQVANLAPGSSIDVSPAHRYDNVVYNKATKKFNLAYDSNDAYNEFVGGSGVTYYWGINCAKDTSAS
ncbi:hypothetical protein [Francisella sp. 19X1-34]|uniref:hypothetical protein n=1 Tax=Francisella sp. 19X1-34 TaxID=3087177 RepID=UPI002E363A60|nr:hypothetical protein [Francisella sp. 19X1-34]MED7788499.1 hypothetical protein [Francisella sp. 19X1-34]